MICGKPYATHAGVFACMRCKPCKFNHRRLWTSRIRLEQLYHGDSCFLTLTYADVPTGHHGPPMRCVWSLDDRHLVLFLKRLRRARGPFRYYACGEYGERYGRAHFHAALFGVSALEADIIQTCWPWGFIHVGDLTRQSAGYIAGYVTKKLWGELEDRRLCGREPEFSSMSRHPGIGAQAADEHADQLAALGDFGALDVPSEVRMDGRKWPLGKYLRNRVRKKMGFPGECPPEARRDMAVKKVLESVALGPSALASRRADSVATAEARFKIMAAKEKL